VWVVFVMILNPGADQSHECLGVGQRRHTDIVVPQGLPGSLQNAIELGIADWREAGLEAELAGEDACLFRGMGAAVVGKNLDDLGSLMRPEPTLDSFEQIAESLYQLIGRTLLNATGGADQPVGG
jgi:hypothetical protein